MNPETEKNEAVVLQDPVLGALRERVEALFVEVRRQGRAGIAAQAAAESCMKSLQELQASPPPSSEANATAGVSATALIERLLPVFDAIDGAATEARRLTPEQHSAAASPSLLASWRQRLAAAVAAPEPARNSLATGVLLIQSELRRALAAVGVTLDDKTGTPVNPERHRVVSVRKNGQESQATVLEVLRPGYSVAGTVLREADVIASAEIGPAHMKGTTRDN